MNYQDKTRKAIETLVGKPATPNYNGRDGNGYQPLPGSEPSTPPGPDAPTKVLANVSAFEVFRIAGGDVECCPNPTAEEALACLRDLRQCYDEALRQPQYDTGTPTKVGVYACRVPLEGAHPLCEDIFLMWIDNRWSYLGSDQFYRGQVLGFIGPLPRTKREKVDE